ncbi:MAG: trypsin-like peptidase domain-containing protein [Bacteroidota bacterium]
MMRSLIHLSLAVLLIFSTSCASIFNARFQAVEITKGSADTELYVDGEKIEESGKNVTARVERDAKIRQIRAEREGYKPEFSVIAQRKISGLRFLPLAFIPIVGIIGTIADDSDTGVAAAAGSFVLITPLALLDAGTKSRNYERTNYVEAPERMLTYRGEDEKYLFSQEIQFDLKQDSFEIFVSTEKQYIGYADRLNSVMVNDEDISIENTIFTDAINGLLYKTDFMDTTQNILKQKSNTSYLNAQILSIRNYKLTIPGLYGAGYYISKVNVNWEVTNIYGKTIYEKTSRGVSGEFSGTIPEEFDAVKYSIKDAIESSLLDFFQEEEVKEILKKDQEEKENLDPITLNPTVNTPKSLEDAQAATVTIKVDDGHGSGFFVTDDGFVLTNYHVVATTEDTLTILTLDGESFEGVLIRKDEANDLALIKVDAEPKVAFGFPNEKNFEVGNNIFTIGTPTSIELGQTLSRGIISGERKAGESELIQTDASINFGNSGGPIVSEQGELVGIINSKLVGLGVEGIAFGSPAYRLKEYLNLLVE